MAEKVELTGQGKGFWPWIIKLTELKEANYPVWIAHGLGPVKSEETELEASSKWVNLPNEAPETRETKRTKATRTKEKTEFEGDTLKLEGTVTATAERKIRNVALFAGEKPEAEFSTTVKAGTNPKGTSEITVETSSATKWAAKYWVQIRNEVMEVKTAESTTKFLFKRAVNGTSTYNEEIKEGERLTCGIQPLPAIVNGTEITTIEAKNMASYMYAVANMGGEIFLKNTDEITYVWKIQYK